MVPEGVSRGPKWFQGVPNDSHHLKPELIGQIMGGGTGISVKQHLLASEQAAKILVNKSTSKSQIGVLHSPLSGERQRGRKEGRRSQQKPAESTAFPQVNEASKLYTPSFFYKGHSNFWHRPVPSLFQFFFLGLSLILSLIFPTFLMACPLHHLLL